MYLVPVLIHVELNLVLVIHTYGCIVLVPISTGVPAIMYSWACYNMYYHVWDSYTKLALSSTWKYLKKKVHVHVLQARMQVRSTCTAVPVCEVPSTKFSASFVLCLQVPAPILFFNINLLGPHFQILATRPTRFWATRPQFWFMTLTTQPLEKWS